MARPGLKNIEGRPFGPESEAAERVFKKHIEDYTKQVVDAEWRDRHPILGFCRDGCFEMLKGAVTVMVGIVTLVSATYGASKIIGWPNLVSVTEHLGDIRRLEDKVVKGLGDINSKLTQYFVNLQRMAWVNRIELIENRRSVRRRDRQEAGIAIDLHQQEYKRGDVDNFTRTQLQQRITTLKEMIAQMDREDEQDRAEQLRYGQMLQQSDGQTGQVTPPGVRRLLDGK